MCNKCSSKLKSVCNDIEINIQISKVKLIMIE